MGVPRVCVAKEIEKEKGGAAVTGAAPRSGV
jgi:hypothetical protein